MPTEGGLHIELLDPLAGFDQEPLAEAWADPDVEIVLHAGGQDVAILRRAWGVQFHAEVTAATLGGWLDSYGRDEDVRAANVDPAELAAQSEREAPRWNELGRRLATAFLEAATSV